MVVKILLAALLVALCYLVVFDGMPAMTAYDTCALSLSTNFDSIHNQQKRVGIRTSDMCGIEYDQLIEDISCIDKTRENYVTGRIIFWVTKARATVNDVIREHNRFCNGYEIPLYQLVAPEDIPGR